MQTTHTNGGLHFCISSLTFQRRPSELIVRRNYGRRNMVGQGVLASIAEDLAGKVMETCELAFVDFTLASVADGTHGELLVGESLHASLLAADD